jgi:hypothetical protein
MDNITGFEWQFIFGLSWDLQLEKPLFRKNWKYSTSLNSKVISKKGLPLRSQPSWFRLVINQDCF